ncbi:MAG TPA: sigma-70 family RNA polymerase sigma factor [Kiritimatiellia bacterium]|nr:sigma-70 family RNA polymerase sigma factor [Kiritimatiellia bacterium]HRZ12795.1 sigma-70 family RNA polymerase sigma factor [Kiritimatiellia bacterium]HSA18253.1 sigma-70 family RNA polymerase sigma factor [Kiritimatiellia bacterium]
MDSSWEMEDEFLARLRTGAQEAWTQFFFRFDPFIRSVVCWSKWGFDSTAREDVMQNIRTEIPRAIANYRGEQPFRIFLRGICIHRCADEVRRQIKQRERYLPMDVPTSDGETRHLDYAAGEDFDPVYAIAEAERAALLRQLLEDMGPPCNQALKNFYLEDLSYKDMAARSGEPISTIGNRLARCLERLKEKVQKIPFYRIYVPRKATVPVDETDMNTNESGRPELWKHVHGQADTAEAEALRASVRTDATLRRELEARAQLDARFRRLLKVSEQSQAALEERIGELWERSRTLAAKPESRILTFWKPALVALAATLALVIGAVTMSPEGLVWMAPGLDAGAVRGPDGVEQAFYSEAELQDFAQSLQQSVASTYADRDGPSGWIARWTGRQRSVRSTIRAFPDGRILATLEAFRSPGDSATGTWSESFANAEDFSLNAGDWAGRVAEEIVADSEARN